MNRRNASALLLMIIVGTLVGMVMTSDLPNYAIEQPICQPTPQMGTGPLYFTNHPYTPNGIICALPLSMDGANNAAIMMATNRFRRRIVYGNNVITVEGTIRSSEGCQPIINAVLDVWQSNSLGLYSLFSKTSYDEGQCRGWFSTDGMNLHKVEHPGYFQFQTQLPGSYGMQFGGMGLLGHTRDIPLWGPRHIHLVVAAIDHVVLSTEIHFIDDPLLGKDWRGRSYPIIAQVGVDGVVDVGDIVLQVTDTDDARELSRQPLAQQMRVHFCRPSYHPDGPPHLCAPHTMESWIVDCITLVSFAILVAYAIVTCAMLYIVYRIGSWVRSLTFTREKQKIV